MAGGSVALAASYMLAGLLLVTAGSIGLYRLGYRRGQRDERRAAAVVRRLSRNGRGII